MELRYLWKTTRKNWLTCKYKLFISTLVLYGLHITSVIPFQGEGESQFIQAAGLAFDNCGNFLAICSKTSRISAFRADGSFMCDVSI